MTHVLIRSLLVSMAMMELTPLVSAAEDLPASAQFVIWDHNGDGVWSRTESRISEATAAFLAADLNGDIAVPLAEYLSAQPEASAKIIHVWRQHDVNQDGKIDISEYLPAAGEPAVIAAAKAEFPRYDRDRDAYLSLEEFVNTPRSALSYQARFRWLDVDGDGRLSKTEMAQSFADAYRNLARLEFWWCRGEGQDFLSREQYQQHDWKRTRTVAEEFALRNADEDPQLTMEEFAAWDFGGVSAASRQLFVIFDANADERLTVDEFAAVPGVQPDVSRVVPDPVVQAYESNLAELLAGFAATKRTSWTAATWPERALEPLFSEAGARSFDVWDLDADGSVVAAELERGLRQAYGIETPAGLPLRTPNGRVFNGAYFNSIDADDDGRMSLAEFTKSYYRGAEQNAKDFAEIDADQDQFIDLAELLRGPWFLSGIFEEFRRMDVDQNGSVDAQEYEQQTYSWHKSLQSSVWSAFDEDKNGVFTFAEFRMTPPANGTHDWYLSQADADFDGRLGLEEFCPAARTHSGLWMAGLRQLLFQQFDRNASGYLERNEYPITVNVQQMTAAAVHAYRDLDGNGTINWTELAASLQDNQHARFRQMFAVFDADTNGELNFEEFLAFPEVIRTPERKTPHPLYRERDRSLMQVQELLQSRDRNRDGRWSAAEWPGLSDWGGPFQDVDLVKHAKWDFDGDGTVSSDELRTGIDLAYGLIDPLERRFRWKFPDGGVYDGAYWRGIGAADNDLISREEFQSRFREKGEAGEKAFAEIDTNADGILEPSEAFVTSRLRHNPINDFLKFDADKDGRLTRDELDANIESWRKRAAEHVFPGFDTNNDGALSLDEYQYTLVAHPIHDWYGTSTDADGDGRLNVSEFCPTATSLPPQWLWLLRRSLFERFDQNDDRLLDLKEFSFKINLQAMTAAAVYAYRDTDADGSISWNELAATQPADRHPQWQQLFAVYDADRDRRLSLDEFRALPEVVKGADRTVPDPIRDERERWHAALVTLLDSADRNQDRCWDPSEWPAGATLLPVVGDALLLAHATWDWDGDRQVTAEELASGADLAFGLVDPLDRKASWRRLDGQVFAGGNWRSYDKNGNGQFERDEFLANYYLKGEEAEKRFSQADTNQDAILSHPEIFVAGWMLANPVGDFLRLDADRNGRVSRDELLTGIETWRKSLAESTFPAFDADADGELSLREYRGAPVANFVIDWAATQTDLNGDGMLDRAEFFHPSTDRSPLWMSGLKSFVFARLDLNHDGQLAGDEYRYNGRMPDVLAAAEWGPDPVVLQYQRVRDAFREWLGSADQDRSGTLSQSEWPRPFVERDIPVHELQGYAVWDDNADGQVTALEFDLVLRQAWGITARRSPTDWLRRGSGHIVDFNTFVNTDANGSGTISREEFLGKFYGTPAEREQWFPQMDRDQDRAITLREMLVSGRLLWSPWDTFQKFDGNKDGKISREELSRNAESWQQAVAALSLPTFDDDEDGALSPQEFRWTPLGNPVIPWTKKPTDASRDGVLSIEEFYTRPTGESNIWGILLAYEHFRRWDKNHDGHLALDEYQYSVDVANLDPKASFRYSDKNQTGALESDEVFLDAKPDSNNAAGVVAYHRRKMRSEEAFLAADSDGDRKLTEAEYAKFREFMDPAGAAPGSAAELPTAATPIPVARTLMTWEETLAYGFTGLNLLLALVGGIYWMLKRRAT